jgi:hypothetical protein
MGAVELAAGSLYFMILILRYCAFPFNESILLCSTIVFSVYFISAGMGIRKKTFILFSLLRNDDEEKLLVIFRFLGGVSFASVFWCIWLHETYHPWREHVSLAVSLLLAIVLFFSVYLFEDRIPQFSKSILIRGVPMSIAIVMYMTFSVETRIKWRYDDNYYRELLIYALSNPEDLDAQNRAARYYEQIQGLRSAPAYFHGVDETQ